jgi:hypothetical protein
LSPKAISETNSFFQQCKIDSFSVQAGGLKVVNLPNCIKSKADELESIMMLDNSPLSTQSKLDSTGTLIYRPLLTSTGIYSQSVSLKDSRLKKIATFKFKVTVQTPPPVKVFQCPYGKMERCHPRIIGVD